jgi:hypothetical protein
MATRDKGTERWRAEHEAGGPGSRNDTSDYGRSSEYGANFRDSSIYGGDRSQYGRYGTNEHYQGNDAGVPYQANRYGQDGGWYGGEQRYGNEARYGRDTHRDRWNSESRFGGDRWNSDYRYGGEQGRDFYGRERTMSDYRYGGEDGGNAMRDYGATSGNEYRNRMSSWQRESPPDYDSSLWGAGQTYGTRGAMSPGRHASGEEWYANSRYGGPHGYGGQPHESMLQRVGRFFGIGPKGYKRSDTRIQEDVNDALMDDDFVDATHIEVIVKDAEVTLEGFVEDRITKRRAEDVVCNVRGVKDCHNHLKIRPLSQTNINSALAGESSAPTNGSERKDRGRQSSVS